MKCLDIIMFMSILGFLTLNSSICFSENSTLVYEQKSQNHKYSKVTINKSLINKPLSHSSKKNVTTKSIIVRKKDKQVENDISYSFNFIDDNALINDNETTTARDQALRKSNKDVRYFFPNLTAYQPDGWDSAIVLSNQSNTHTNNDIYVNEPAYIDFAFVNNGYENITDIFYLYLYINDQMIYYDSIYGLESGYYVDVEDIEVTFQNAGFYTISMVCDPENFVYEMNENDNIYNAYANILESKVYPDLMPYKRQGWEDIIVVSNCSGTNTNDQLYPGDTAYIDFTIANSGEDDVIQEFQAALLVNGTIIKVMNIDVLEMEYYVSFEDIEYEIPEEGTYNFSIICDYNNVIPEMVEDNNVHQKIIQVEPINVQTDLRTYSFSNWKNFVLSLEKDTQISNTIVSGRKTYIDYIILNDSEEDINNNFIVDLYVNNTKIHSQFVDNLPSQSTLTISDIEYVFPSSGSYSLTVIIDPDNSIRETKEDNNVYTMNIEILPSYSKPNLLPFKPTYWDDIIVVSNLADTNNNDFIFAGETTYLDFFIANMGTVDITDEFFISIYVNQTLLQQYSTQDLSVGQGTSFLDIVYNFKQSGDYTIKIICDIDNNILESNESDNTYQRIIHVADKNLPPSNDNFVDAIAITGISGHITGSNNNSSIEPGEPNHANVFGVQRGNTSVWWKWIAPETAHFSFDTHDSTLNTLLGIYTGEKVDNLKEIASNNHDGSINATSSVIFSCQKGLQYYIAIAGSYNEIGNIDLRWKKIIRPSNDDFSNATIISGTTGYTTGTNVYASKEQYEPKHANRNGGKSIWWKWTSPANGYYYFSSEFKRQYDKETFIAIYKGDSLITLTEIASNYINGSFSIFIDLSDYSVHQVFQSGSAFYAEQGKSFYIAVDGYSGKTGSISLYWEQVTPPLNDNYSQATLISGSSGSITITNKNATKEIHEQNHRGYIGGKSVWLKWVAPTTDFYNIHTKETFYERIVACYTGNQLENLVFVQAGYKQMLFKAQKQQEYYFVFDSPVEKETVFNWSTFISNIDKQHYSMRLHGQAFINNEPIQDSGYSLLAIGPGGITDCLGIAEFIQIGNEWGYMIDIYSDQPDTKISFLIFDDKSRVLEVKDTITFKPDANLAIDINKHLYLKSVYPTIGDVNKNLEAILLGDGFTNDTRVSMSLLVKKTNNVIGSINTKRTIYSRFLLDNYIFTVDGSNEISIYDVSNPSMPKLVSTQHLNGSGQKIYIEGNTAYISINGEGWEGIDIVDIRDPLNCSIISTYKYQDAITNITMSNDIMYIISKNNLVLIDVQDPHTPKEISRIVTTCRGQDITICNNTAYVIGNQISFFDMIDIADPYNPRFISSVSTPGKIYKLSVSDNYVYIANGAAGLQIIDISNKDLPKFISNDFFMVPVYTKIVGNKLFIHDIAKGIVVVDISEPLNSYITETLFLESTDLNYIYNIYGNLIIYNTVDRLKIIDIRNNKPPNCIGTYKPVKPKLKDIKIINNIGYVTNIANGLQLIDISKPSNPEIISSIQTKNAVRVTIHGNNAFVADYYDGLKIIDISVPTSLRIIGSVYKKNFYCRESKVIGNIAYIAWGAYPGGLVQIVDVTNPSQPVERGAIATPGWCFSVAIKGNTVYATNKYDDMTANADQQKGNSLQIIDASDLDNPKTINYIILPSEATRAVVDGNYLYLLGAFGLKIYDITISNNPIEKSHIVIANNADNFIKVSNGKAYIAGKDLYVVDVTNPLKPYLIGSVETPGSASGVDVIQGKENIAFVADFTEGLSIVPLPIEISPITAINDTKISLTIAPPKMVGDYTIRVFNEKEGSEIKGAITFLETSLITQLRYQKAIIVAGRRHENDVLWREKFTQTCTNYSYNALLFQGYDKKNIYYLSPAKSKDDIDVDGDGTFNDITSNATINDLNYAITTWAKDANELLLYITDHGGDGSFQINENEILKAEDLDRWLDELQNHIPGQVIVIYDACKSGSFLPLMKPPEGKKRIVITSSESDKDALFDKQGNLSFSYQFWASVYSNANLYDAYVKATNMMSSYSFKQNPIFDANGDGKFEPKIDIRQMDNINIGRGLIKLSALPVIQKTFSDLLLNGSSYANIWADDIQSLNPIHRVYATIIPPDYYSQPDNPITNLPVIEMIDSNNDGKYLYTYTNFNKQGTYRIVIYAEDIYHNISLPINRIVTQANGIKSPTGDIDGDGNLTLRDAVLVLQVLSQSNAEIIRYSYSTSGVDLNDKNRIGVEEFLYILNKISN